MISSEDMIQALVGNGPSLTSGIGFEPAGRALRLILLDQLNDEIAVQQALWMAADLKLQELGMDEGVGQVEVPPVPASNLHEGPKKSLIKAPPSAFPNVSAMAYVTVPAASQAFDQASSSEITLFVESMALSGPVAPGTETSHETIVHRRIQRMTEAVATVIERNPTLLGTVHGLRTPPRGGVGNNSWLNSNDEGAGEKYIWHGSRLQYTLTRHHS